MTRAQPSVIIVGGGTMGLASAWRLAHRGFRVTVVEQYEIVHGFGSHGGATRIIRQAYHEGGDYIELVRASQSMWLELESLTCSRLLVPTGMLEFGPSTDADLAATIAACEQEGVAYRRLTPQDAMAKWAFRIPRDWVCCFTPDAGYLYVDACMQAMRSMARRHGARVITRQRVVHLDDSGSDRRVWLEDGSTLQADHLVLAAGAYTPELMPTLVGLRRLRRIQLWQQPAVDDDALTKLPVFAAFTPQGFFYGFPCRADAFGGVKVGHHTDPSEPRTMDLDPRLMDRNATERDCELLLDFTRNHVPSASGPVLHTHVCVYTATPDWNFIVDRHPTLSSSVVVAGFSGHGFKFAPAIGELVADLLEGVPARWHAAQRFSLSRLSSP